MKSFGGKILKFILILLYPVIVVLLIAVSVVLFLRMRDVDNALDKYNEIYSTYDIQGTPKQNISNAMEDAREIVGELFMGLEESSREIESLRNQVESEQKDGFGEIRGRILAFVSQGESLNRYQRVCAEVTENANKQYCVSVSAIEASYNLVVPEGEYYVFAQLQDDPTSTEKAYYTEFVRCSKEGSGRCEESLSDTKILVTVDSGGIVQGIDPMDWPTIDDLTIPTDNVEEPEDSVEEEQAEESAPEEGQ